MHISFPLISWELCFSSKKQLILTFGTKTAAYDIVPI
uniref:Uncharacterized protein n=1 Tax=Arundo donax TaxID=35708 RepID=A0A0A8YBI0_ARUDO